MSQVAPTPLCDVTADRITPSDQNTDALDRRRLDGAVCSERRRSDGCRSNVDDRPKHCSDDASDASRSVVGGRDDAVDDGVDVFQLNTTMNTRQCCQCQLSDR